MTKLRESAMQVRNYVSRERSTPPEQVIVGRLSAATVPSRWFPKTLAPCVCAQDLRTANAALANELIRAKLVHDQVRNWAIVQREGHQRRTGR